MKPHSYCPVCEARIWEGEDPDAHIFRSVAFATEHGYAYVGKGKSLKSLHKRLITAVPKELFIVGPEGEAYLPMPVMFVYDTLEDIAQLSPDDLRKWITRVALDPESYAIFQMLVDSCGEDEAIDRAANLFDLPQEESEEDEE